MQAFLRVYLPRLKPRASNALYGEKGQADLSAFQVRIYIDPDSGVLPGQTIGVDF